MSPTSHGPGAGASCPASTSSSLLERVRARDAAAWERLVDLYTPLVYRWCRQAGLSPDDAADVVQEVLVSVARSIDDFRGAGPSGSFRAWLRGITRHRLLDLFRRRHGSPQARGGTEAQLEFLQVAEPMEVSATGAPGAEEDALWRRVLELVRAEFEDRTWQAFWRVVVDARTPAETASELGMTLAAVYKAKSRVLRRVRDQLGELEGDG
jgi:RNA polymerase sigma-70 factor (ECF subfamily)